MMLLRARCAVRPGHRQRIARAIASFMAPLMLLVACSAPARETPVARPALWEVADASGRPAGWLFGTIHALPASARWGGPPLDRAMREAGVLVVEVRDLDPAKIGPVFQRLASDQPGPPLEERLSAADRGRLAPLMAAGGHRIATLDRLESWAAALALAQLAAAGTAEIGVDRALIARFGPGRTAELEGAERQLAIFDKLPERDQRAMLSAVIADAARGDAEEQAAALAEAWLAGDIARLERETGRGLLTEPALARALLTDRNRAWLEPVAVHLSSGRRPLVAVGAAHLLGPEGLVALLARRGYRIVRVQ